MGSAKGIGLFFFALGKKADEVIRMQDGQLV